MAKPTRNFRKGVEGKMREMGLSPTEVREGLRRTGIVNDDPIQRSPRTQHEILAIAELDRSLRHDKRKGIHDMLIELQRQREELGEEIAQELQSANFSQMSADAERVIADSAEIVTRYNQAMRFAEQGHAQTYTSIFSLMPGMVAKTTALANDTYQAFANLVGDERDANSPLSRGVSSLRNIAQSLDKINTTIRNSDVAKVVDKPGRSKI